MKTLITSGEAMENESADWATGQPVGAGVFFSLLEDNDLFLFSGILAVHTQQQKKNHSKCLLVKSQAAEHHV